MSGPLPRTKTKNVTFPSGGVITDRRPGGKTSPVKGGQFFGTDTDVLHQSEGHPLDRKTGRRVGGGPFHVVHTRTIMNPSHLSNASSYTFPPNVFSGPVLIPPAVAGSMLAYPIASNYKGTVSKTPPNMDADGTTAISLCAPTNPTANLSTTMAEIFREGIPSLPGIQTWRKRTLDLKALGSEYLNYQFGWAPLKKEVDSTVSAVRHHRDILQNYHHGEGNNVHRRFDFDSVSQVWSEDCGTAFLNGTDVPVQFFQQPARCQLTVEKHVKKYFVGCFTYGGPSRVDSFGRALGYGSDADKLFGITLTPNVLWELTPWSWAVDWFTNTGDLINNITNFATAGLVMRYGYMMCETIYRKYVSWSDLETKQGTYNPKTESLDNVKLVKQGGGGSLGFEAVEKSRAPANPFGFGIGWEDLSPTQLAITAAIGITRLL